jgi:hypothetical protein
VDDILAVVDEQESEKFKNHLEEKFGEVKFKRNNKLSYLGMEIEITDEGTIVDMSFFVHQLLKENGQGVKVMSAPGTKEMYMVDEKLELLEKNEQKWVHLVMAKLLYLAKRA